MKTLQALAASLLMLPLCAAWADPGVVQGTSLTVKERLHSIEQINVAAEKPAVDVQPVSDAVANLLAEADAADQATGAVQGEASH